MFTTPELVDAAGNVLAGTQSIHDGILDVFLNAGTTYYLRVEGSTSASRSVYDLVFSIGTGNENPTPLPLTVGAAPALRLQLVSNVPPPIPPLPPSGPTLPSLPTPPGLPISVVTTTTQSTDPGASDGTGSSGLINPLPDIANALAASPLGGTRSPGTTPDAMPQVVLFNLTAPAIVTTGAAATNGTSLAGGVSGDESVDGFFGRITASWQRLTEMTTQVKDVLFSSDILLRSSSFSGNEEQEPQPQPVPDEDPDEEAAVVVPVVPSADARVNPDRRSALDGLWTLGFGLAGSLGMRGRVKDEKKTWRRAAPFGRR